MLSILIFLLLIHRTLQDPVTTKTITNFNAEFHVDQARFLENLTQENFYAAINKHRLSLVVFYAPWCEHSMHTIEEMRKAAKLLGKFPKITLMTVNVIEYDRVADFERVNAYPTLKMYVFIHLHPLSTPQLNQPSSKHRYSKGKFVDTYAGSYDAVGMTKFMTWYNQFFMNSVKFLSSRQSVERYLDKARDTVVLGAFVSEFDSRLTDIAKDLAMDYKFAYCMTEDLPLSMLDLSEEPNDDIVYVVKSKRYESELERPRVRSTLNLDKKKFKSFLHETNLPLVGEMDAMSRERYYDHTQDSTLVVLYVVFEFVTSTHSLLHCTSRIIPTLEHHNRYVKDLSLDSKRFRYLTDVLRDVALKFSDLVFAVAEVFEMSYCNVDEHDMDYVVVAERGRGEFAASFLGLVERDHNRAMDVELSYSFSELSPLIEWLETGLSLSTPIRGMFFRS